MKIRWDVLGAEAPGGFKGTGAGLTLGRSAALYTPRSDPRSTCARSLAIFLAAEVL